MVGYSEKPLVQKLGIKENMSVCFLHEPENYIDLLGVVPISVQVHFSLQKEYEFIQYFSHAKQELEKEFPFLVRALKKNRHALDFLAKSRSASSG